MLIRRRTKIILAALLAFFILFPTDVYKLVFFSHTQEFTVTKNDAPEYCNKWHKSPWNWYGNTRSSVPEHEFEGFAVRSRPTWDTINFLKTIHSSALTSIGPDRISTGG